MAKTSSKRSAAAVSGATTSRSGAGGSSAKRTRFVSPSENPATFAEDVDEALETKSRKGRVRTEGYDSDSTDDGEGVVFSRKGGGGEDGEEEDEDMFAAGSDDEKKKGRAGDDASMKKKKETKFLRLGDIEGQEFNDHDEGGSNHSYHSDDDLKSTTSGSESPLDEDDRVRRSKAGMGYTLSSFNMREEMEEGKFAADGTFVRTFDPHAMHDRWLDDVGGVDGAAVAGGVGGDGEGGVGDGVAEREIRRARRAKRRRERGERERRRRERDEEGGKEDMEKELLGILREGESVLEALARLGKEAAKVKKSLPKQRHKQTQKADADSMAIDISAPSTTTPAPSTTLTSSTTTPPTDTPTAGTSTTTPAQAQIDRITTLASNLLAMGDTDIYSKTYRQLLVSLRSSDAVPEGWTPHPNDQNHSQNQDQPQHQSDQPPSSSTQPDGKKYEYKWSVANAPPDTFGPFSRDEMLAWNKARYFGESGEKVKVRVVLPATGGGGGGGESGGWADWNDIFGAEES